MTETSTPDKHFDVRLVAQDGTDNWRAMTVQAPDEDEARFIVETKERAIVAHKLSDEDLDEHEAIETAALKAKEPVPPATVSALHSHRQAKPYKVTKVTEVPVR